MVQQFTLTFVLIGVLSVYVRTLEGPFLWDDRQLIVERLDDLERTTAHGAFSQPYFQERTGVRDATYYRPLTTLSLVTDARLHGANAGGFHFTNVLFHLINTSLLYALARRWGAGTTAAAVAAAAWALQPRSAEAVAWISGRTDVLATTFVLAALMAHRSTDWKRNAATSALLLLGLISKEVGLAGYAAVLALEWCAQRDARHGAAKRASAFLPLAVSASIYGLLRSHALPGEAVNLSDALSLPRRLPTALEALGRYAVDLCTPWSPRDQQGELALFDWKYGAVGCAVVLALAVAAWCRRVSVRPHRAPVEPRILASWILGLTSIGLVLHLVLMPTHQVAADRFLYTAYGRVCSGPFPFS